MIIGENYFDFKELYLTCFPEDTKEDADFLFNTVFKKAHCICRVENEKPIAMLFLMDCNLVTKKGEHPFYYLYAAATHPDYRGRGIMGELLSDAKAFALKNGRGGIFLKPATKSLFDFYKKYGFSPFFRINKLNFSREELGKIPVIDKKDIIKIPTEDWREKRKELLSSLSDCFGDFSKDLYTAATEGCNILSYGGVYAVYEVREKTLLIKECLYKNENSKGLLPLVKYLFEKTDTKMAEIRMTVTQKAPEGFLGLEQTDFSVIWDGKKAESVKANAPYHGFAFD